MNRLILLGLGLGALLLAGLPVRAQQVINGNRVFVTGTGTQSLCANDNSTGTTLNLLAKATSTGCIKATTTDTNVPVWIVTSATAITGNATLAQSGQASCVMDTTVASGALGYYVVESTTTNGQCHPQSGQPTGVFIVGILLATSTTSGSPANVQIVSTLNAAGGGSGVWSSLTAPSGNLSLSMAANTSAFNTTTAQAQMFAWKNTTAAIVGTSQGSPAPAICGRAWHGSADVEDCLTLSELPGNGNDAPVTFNIGHTGSSTGAVTTVLPGPIQAGASGGVGGTITLPEGTAATASSGNDVCYGDSTAHAVKCSFNNGSFNQLATAFAFPLFPGISSQAFSASTTYFGASDGGAIAGSCASFPNLLSWTSPVSGTITGLYVNTYASVVATGAGTVTVTLYKNCSATSLTTTQNWTSASNPAVASDTAHTVAVAAGDELQIQIVTPAWSGNPAGVRLGTWVKIVGAN